MIPGRMKIAFLTAFLTTFVGACNRLHNRERTHDMIDDTGRCSLSPGALAERKTIIRASLGSKLLETKELVDGIAIRFPTDSQTIRAVFEFVTAERSCCGSFLTFEVILNGGDGAFWLRMRGDGEAKEFIKRIISAAPRLPIVDPEVSY